MKGFETHCLQDIEVSRHFVQPPFVTQLVAGNRGAFAALYDRLGKKLCATAVQLNCTDQEAEDIAHDLFVELAHHRQELSDVKTCGLYFHHAAKRCQPPAVMKKTGLKEPAMGL